jgi:WD40 repeat protein
MLGGQTYNSTKLDDLPSIATDFTIVKRLFTTRLRQSYEVALPRLRSCQTPASVRKAISTWSRHLQPRDVVTVYFSGHSLAAPGRLYLALRQTDPEELAATALPAEDVIRSILEPSDVKHLLMILDTCYAGAGAEDIVQASLALVNGQPLGQSAPQVTVIGRAGSREPADPNSAFAQAFEDAVLEPGSGGEQQECLSVSHVLSLIRQAMPPEELGKPLSFNGPQSGPCLPLPNPRYFPVPSDMTVAAQRKLRRIRKDHLATEGADQVEFKEFRSVDEFFEGRTAALEAISTWRHDVSSEFVGCVVTGDIGSGKSALLRHLWQMDADMPAKPGMMADRPSPHSLGAVFIDAAGRNVQELTKIMAEAVAADTNDPAELMRHLADTTEAAEVWIDGVDEAVEPHSVNSQLLRPFLALGSANHRIKLVIGARRSHVPYLPDHTRSTVNIPKILLMDLDKVPYRDEPAIEAYATKLLVALSGSTNPEFDASDPAIESAAQEAVREADGTSFLIAGLVARDLAMRPASEAVRESDGRHSEALDRALKAELNRHASLEGSFGHAGLIDLLRPLAFSKGLGIPRILWPMMASALSESATYNDGDIERLLRVAGDLLREDIDADGNSVYRLFHKSFTEYIKRGRSDKDTAAAIVGGIVNLIPINTVTHLRDWLSADSYTKNHLAEHAADAGSLAELVEDPLYQVTANPAQLNRALRISNVDSDAVSIFRMAYHHMSRSLSVADRISYLKLTALTLRNRSFAARIDEINVIRTWEPQWAHLSLPDHRLMLNAHEGSARALDLGMIDDEVVAISGGDDGRIAVWELKDGLKRAAFEAHNGLVSEVKFIRVDDVPAAISSGADDVVRVWDIRDGYLISEFAGHVQGPIRLATGLDRGSAVVISADHYGEIWAWNPKDGGAIRQFTLKLAPKKKGRSGKKGKDKAGRSAKEVRAVAFGQVDGLPTVAALTGKGVLNWWRYEDGELVGVIKCPNAHDFIQAAGSSGFGPATVVFGSLGYPWQIWSPDLGMPAPQPLPIRRPEGISVHNLADETLLVFVLSSLEIWDAARRAVIQKVGFTADYAADTALYRADDRYVIAVGADDGRLRVYDVLRTETRRYEPATPNDSITSVAISVSGSGSFAAVGGHHVSLLDLHSGNRLRQWPKSWDWTRNVRFCTVGTDSVVIAGDDRGMVKVWRAESGRLISDWLTGHSWALALAADRIEDEYIVLTGGQGPEVKRRNLMTGEDIGGFSLDGPAQVTDLLIARIPGRTLAVASGNGGRHTVWDLRNLQCIASFDAILCRGEVVLLRRADGDQALTIDSSGHFAYVNLLTGSRLPKDVLCDISEQYIEHLSATSTSVGDLALTTGNDGVVNLWNLTTGSLVSSIRFDQPVHAIDAVWEDDKKSLLLVAGMANGSACIAIPVG